MKAAFLLFVALPVLAAAGPSAELVEAGAKAQLKHPSWYDPSYRKLDYPMGDVPADRGVCTDVVVRALRHAGLDLQKLIHEDIRRAPRAYPIQGRRDSNIDHRRVPNQAAWFKRHWRTLPARLGRPANWRAGDIVAWKLDNGRDHIGVVVSGAGASGFPKVVHNLAQTAEEDCLPSWRIVGHWRFPRE